MRSVERVFVITDLTQQRPQAYVFVTNGTSYPHDRVVYVTNGTPFQPQSTIFITNGTNIPATERVWVMNPEALRSLRFPS